MAQSNSAAIPRGPVRISKYILNPSVNPYQISPMNCFVHISDKSNHHPYFLQLHLDPFFDRKKPPINTHSTVTMSKLGLYLKLLAAYEFPPSKPPPRSGSK